MRTVVLVVIVVVFGVLAWTIGSRLSTDAVGMAVGMVFGVMAGVPTALLVLAGGRRRQDDPIEQDEDPRTPMGLAQGPYGYPSPYQAPVIVLAAPAPQQPWPQAPTVDSVGYPVRPALPGPSAPRAAGGRTFKMVGEQEESIDEW